MYNELKGEVVHRDGIIVVIEVSIVPNSNEIKGNTTIKEVSIDIFKEFYNLNKVVYSYSDWFYVFINYKK